MTTRPAARFDDLRPRHRRGFALDRIDQVIEAHGPDEVMGAIATVESAVQEGRWVAGWVAYEAAPAFDPALQVNDPNTGLHRGLPLVWFGVSDRRVPVADAEVAGYDLGPWEPLSDADHHHAAIEEIHRRIRAGDTYQVNNTFQLRSNFSGDAGAFYRQLTRSQSCGYGALVDTGEWIVASASPELFFEWRNGAITCRPMKGTSRRGLDLADDEAMRAWLAASEKNRAENLMIVDMVRNDLGRIARVGTVSTPEMFTTEKYDTVWQLTSTVRGRPRPDVDLADVLVALFPSASITGAPKVSTMAIIAALESQPRGVYCGAIGFGGPGPEGPEWAFNVGIRTVSIHRPSGTALYGTGGGITYDSEPADEYAEALLKTEVLGRQAGELRLLETTRWDPAGGIRHREAHLERAAASAAYFDIPFDPAEVRSAIDRTVKREKEPCRVRIVVDRDGWIEVETSPLPPGSKTVRLALDDQPIDGRDPLLRHKTTLRRRYDDALIRHPHCDDVVLWNQLGQVTETTIGNLAAELDGAWVTPPTASGLLAGTERSARIAAGDITEAVVTVEDLARATRLARLNSVRGWQPAVLVASRR